MLVKEEDWGTYNQKRIKLVKIEDPNSKYEVHLTNLGASINRVRMPDNKGNVTDIHYGRDSVKEFEKVGGYLGATVGRVASLIAFGRFNLNGKIHELSKNMAKVHCQHGGWKGFTSKAWDYKGFTQKNNTVEVSFSYFSQDGEEGFPGSLSVTAKYRVKPLRLEWSYEAKSDKKTIINLTNHAYWNLNGLFKPIDDMHLRIPASQYLEINTPKLVFKTIAEMVRLGKRNSAPMELRSVNNLPFNPNRTNKIGDIFQAFGSLDHNFIIDRSNKEKLKLAARLDSPNTGRSMEVWTTEPAIIAYSGNSVGDLRSFGKNMSDHQSICLEPLKPTNSVQIPELKDWVVLKVNQTYFTRTRLVFSSGN